MEFNSFCAIYSGFVSEKLLSSFIDPLIGVHFNIDGVIRKVHELAKL